MSSSSKLPLNVAPVVRWLSIIILGLLSASLAAQILKFFGGRGSAYGLVPLFNLDTEANIPTFFSALQLLFAALLLAIVATTERRQGRPARDWIVLTAGFFVMSAEEVLSFHERLTIPVRALIGADKYGLFTFTWVIPGIAVVLIFGCFFIPFLVRLPATTRRGFLLAGILYVGGAIGFELLGGSHAEQHSPHNLGFNLYVTVEEGLEMLGVLVFIRTLLQHIALTHSAVVLEFQSLRPTAVTIPTSAAHARSAESGSGQPVG